MKVLIINPILYTCETSNIKKVNTIKDTMIYNLCLAFKNMGHQPTLVAAKDYKPIVEEKYDFNIEFLETKYIKIFKPNCFPLLRGLNRYLKTNKDYYDLIVTGEVFSMSSLFASIILPQKTIIWHELAKHNNILKKIPSKIWYNIIARIFQKNVRVVPRSKNAYNFISKYCSNVCEEYIDHGVNLTEFIGNTEKKEQFVILSQLIKRKRIDGIIRIFDEFIKKVNSNYLLYIIGEGSEEKNLIELTKQLGISDKVIFKGFMMHKDAIPILCESKALLVNTQKDNSMVSIVEALATCTPIITTDIPYNVDYIEKSELGLVKKEISYLDLKEITENNNFYVKQCEKYREKISNEYKVKQFEKQYEIMKSEEYK